MRELKLYIFQSPYKQTLTQQLNNNGSPDTIIRLGEALKKAHAVTDKQQTRISEVLALPQRTPEDWNTIQGILEDSSLFTVIPYDDDMVRKYTVEKTLTYNGNLMFFFSAFDATAFVREHYPDFGKLAEFRNEYMDIIRPMCQRNHMNAIIGWKPDCPDNIQMMYLYDTSELVEYRIS